MNIQITRDSKNRISTFTYKPHVFASAGLLLIGAGLAMLAGPWWLPLAEALAGSAGLVVKPDHHWAYGLLVTTVGFGLLAYKFYGLDKQQVRIEADRKAISLLGPRVQDVRSYLAILAGDHSYKSSLDSSFTEWRTRLLRPESALQERKAAALYAKFADAGNRLQIFASTNFWVFPRERPEDGDYRYCLWPHYNVDREMGAYDPSKSEKYTEFGNQLTALVDEAESAFDELVRHFNKRGHLSNLSG